MVAALPKTAQLKARQALAQWRHWTNGDSLASEPVVRRTLEGGLSNVSVLVTAGEHEFVLRLDGHNPERMGLSRAAEWRAHNNAAAMGLAPRPVYFSPELGVLISEFCQQDATRLTDAEELRAIATLLREIHSLPAVKFRLRPMDRALHYLGLLGETAPADDFVEACSRLRASTGACLCHNDLLRENRLQHNGRLLAIDWEYTAMGDPWFDLAVICEGDGLSESQCQQLSEAYLQATPAAEHRQRLQDNRVAYRYLARLWVQLTEL